MDFIRANKLTDDEIKHRLLAAAVHAITQPYVPHAEFPPQQIYGDSPLSDIVPKIGERIIRGKYYEAWMRSGKQNWMRQFFVGNEYMAIFSFELLMSVNN